MLRLAILGALGISLLFSAGARADVSYHFARITCIPKANYFAVDAVSVPADSVIQLSMTTAARRRALALWARHGYYDVHDLRYECRLPGRVYVVKAHTPQPYARGMCGGDPSTTLSLTQDDKPWIDNVEFGGVCFPGNSSIVSFSVPGDGTFVVCVSGEATDWRQECGLAEGNLPLTRDSINTYAAQQAR